MVEGIGRAIADSIIKLIFIAMAVSFAIGIGVGWIIWG